MRTLKLLVVLLVGTFAAAVYVGAGDSSTVTVTGEVIDIAGYAMGKAQGEEGREAGQFRAEQGFPVGILEEETHEVYFAVYKNPAPASALETASGILAPLMGKKVVVRGRLFEQPGVKVLQVAVFSEM